jgi:hypothetical protein
VKILLIAFLFTNICYAGLINAISAKVNDDIITLYEIDELAQANNISNQEALSTLIDKKLFSQEIKKHNITTTQDDIDNHIAKLAKINNTSVENIKKQISKNGSYAKFASEIKQSITNKALIRKISTGKLLSPSNEDIKIYYNNNQDKLSIAGDIEVIKYQSKNKKLLYKIRKNPMFYDKNLKVTDFTLSQNDMVSYEKNLLNSTSESSFTKIVKAKNAFVMYYVIAKKNVQIIELDKVRNKIYSYLAKKREEEFLRNYFNNSKMNAKIEIIR